MSERTQEKLLRWSEDPVIFHGIWIALGFVFTLIVPRGPGTEIPGYISIPGMAAGLLFIPAVWVKIWGMNSDGDSVTTNLGTAFIWIFQMTLVVQLFLFSYTAWAGKEAGPPTAILILLTLMGLCTFGTVSLGENMRIPPGIRILSNLILSLSAIVASKTFIEAAFADPSMRIHLGRDDMGDIFRGLILGMLLWSVLYLPLRYLFIRQDFNRRLGFRERLLFWITLIASMCVDLSGMIRW